MKHKTVDALTTWFRPDVILADFPKQTPRYTALYDRITGRGVANIWKNLHKRVEDRYQIAFSERGLHYSIDLQRERFGRDLFGTILDVYDGNTPSMRYTSLEQSEHEKRVDELFAQLEEYILDEELESVLPMYTHCRYSTQTGSTPLSCLETLHDMKGQILAAITRPDPLIDRKHKDNMQTMARSLSMALCNYFSDHLITPLYDISATLSSHTFNLTTPLNADNIAHLYRDYHKLR
jgi:hypothetical protein